MMQNISAVNARVGLHKPKSKWTPEEDALLLRLVNEKGTDTWGHLAESVPDRTGKQCRERWRSKLSYGSVPSEWTADEDRLLTTLQRDHGNCWSQFRLCLPGRSATAIKNRWTSLCRCELAVEVPGREPQPAAPAPCPDPWAAHDAGHSESLGFSEAMDDLAFPDNDALAWDYLVGDLRGETEPFCDTPKAMKPSHVPWATISDCLGWWP